MFYLEQFSNDIQEPLYLLYKVQFVEITPIDPLMDWEYPKMYHYDCNRNHFSSDPVVFQSTYLYYLNTKIRILCLKFYVIHE